MQGLALLKHICKCMLGRGLLALCHCAVPCRFVIQVGDLPRSWDSSGIAAAMHPPKRFKLAPCGTQARLPP